MRRPLKQHHRPANQESGLTIHNPAPINARGSAAADDPLTRLYRFHPGFSAGAFRLKYRLYALTDALGAPIHLGLENSAGPSVFRTTALPAKLPPRPRFNSTPWERKLWDLWAEDDEPRYTVLGQFETGHSGFQALDFLRDQVLPEELSWIIDAKRRQKPRHFWVYALVEQELDQIFYVGQTRFKGETRRRHFHRDKNPFMAARMAEARGRGHEPLMLEIEKVGNQWDADDTERRWIHLMLKQGQQLVNRQLYGWRWQCADFQISGYPNGGGNGRSHLAQVSEVSNQRAMRASRAGA